MPSTSKLKAFKLLTTSNAYWKGDAKNQPMQRVYGTAFLSESELKTHLQRLEEAKKRDHRKVGKDTGLFMFHKWAPGATFWLAKGTVLWNTLADYMRGVLIPAGYVEVKAPIVFNKALWETSGHWQHYRQNMFLVESEGEQMGLKAMNCPGHFLIYASEVHSYRDLPIRYHEQTPLHRNEASGVLTGLTRVRQFSQDDGHCFVMESQIGEEVERLLRLVQRVYGDFGLKPSMKLSTRPAEFLGAIETWNHAESELRKALDAVGEPYEVNEGDGAFYGPKIDFDVTDAIGRKWQCATIQLDYQMPERFDLKYVGADNAEHRPVVIHRAIFGSFERFIALLIEHYAGAFPLWLSPVQVVVLPIADRHADYARGVRDKLAAAGLRVELDERQEKIGYKIREAQLQKVPYMLVTGDREAAESTVAVRSRAGGDLGGKTLDQFIQDALQEDWKQTRLTLIAAAVEGVRPYFSIQHSAFSIVRRPYRFRQKPTPGRPHAGKRTHQGTRGPGHRRHGRAARHHGAAAGADYRATERPRPRRDCRHGGAACLPDHGLRALPVPGAEARPAGQEAPEDHRGQGNQVPAESR